MRTVKVRDVIIGDGIPKICVPIVAKDSDELRKNLEMIVKSKPDIVEFRADIYEKYMDKDTIMDALRLIRGEIGNTALLYTIRTVGEGGNANVAVFEYVKLLEEACASELIDLIDVEAYIQDGVLTEISKKAHEHNVYVIASNHDFHGTPEEDDIVNRLQYMDENGADIPKIAAMPQCKEDVAALLNATIRYRQKDSKPAITMSMGRLGLISRLSGEIYGSAVTFASAGRSSAPGQIEVDDVRYILKLLHEDKDIQ